MAQKWETVLAEIQPVAAIKDEVMGQKAVDLLKLRRHILENIYELRRHLALRMQYRANRVELETQLDEDKSLAQYHRDHLRGRIAELDAHLWKSQQLDTQFRLELETYIQLLRP